MSIEEPQVRHKTVMDDEARHVSRVYADALYLAAEKRNVADEVRGELDTLVTEVFGRYPGLEALLASAALSKDRKKALLEAVFAGRTTQEFSNFLEVLNEHDRLDMLRPIAHAYHTIHDRKGRRLIVHVTSAVPLIDEERQRLSADVRSLGDIEPVLRETVDPEILGGLIVRVRDWVYDASTRTSLATAQKELIERSSHGIQSGRDRFGN